MGEYEQLFGQGEPVASTSSQDKYPPPAAQTALGEQFEEFYVKAWKDGERQTLDYRDINKACSRAAYLHFREGFRTKVIAVNLTAHTAEELRWQGKDVGYQIYRGS